MTALQNAKLMHTVNSIGAKAIEARREEEFFSHMAGGLQTYVGCDMLILRLLDRSSGTRFVATEGHVKILGSDGLAERFTEEDQARWLSLSDGLFFETAHSAPPIDACLLKYVRDAGMTSGFLVPLVQGGELCGQVVFGWKSVRDLSPPARRLLRSLVDYACIMTAMFQMKKSQELDPVTALPNRLSLNLRWRSAARAPHGALLVAHLEGLKPVNEMHGYSEGDSRLREFAGILRRACGPESIVSRYGGEQFAAVLPEVSRVRAEEIRDAVEKESRTQWSMFPPPWPAATIGLAYWPEDGVDLERLIAFADRRAWERKAMQFPSSFPSGSRSEDLLPGGSGKGERR